MRCEISILIFILLRGDPAPAQLFLNLEAASQKLQCQAGHLGSPYVGTHNAKKQLTPLKMFLKQKTVAITDTYMRVFGDTAQQQSG